MIHHAPLSSAFSDSESILPQLMTSSGRPMPIKLSVDSAAMAARTFITTMNIMEEKKFGARCFRRIWKNPPPMHREAMTYSLFRSRSTSERTTLAMLVHPVTPMTSERLQTFAFPRIACKKIMSSREGMLRKISVKRISRSSSHLGASPLTVPKRTASAVEIPVDSVPISRETRPPYQIMAKISRPIVSVPNQNSPPGASELWSRSIYPGSPDTNAPQKRHPRTMPASTAIETTGLPSYHFLVFTGGGRGVRAPTRTNRSSMIRHLRRRVRPHSGIDPLADDLRQNVAKDH